MMNQRLLEDFMVEEISQALQQMAHLEAPGQDGFSTCFYQQNWGTVHLEVCNAVLQFLNSSHLDKSINATPIALIPRNRSPSSVTIFHSISWGNVIYKFISKVLANRLKLILHDIISYWGI
jgi:hypothetical protein